MQLKITQHKLIDILREFFEQLIFNLAVPTTWTTEQYLRQEILCRFKENFFSMWFLSMFDTRKYLLC